MCVQGGRSNNTWRAKMSDEETLDKLFVRTADEKYIDLIKYLNAVASQMRRGRETNQIKQAIEKIGDGMRLFRKAVIKEQQ